MRQSSAAILDRARSRRGLHERSQEHRGSRRVAVGHASAGPQLGGAASNFAVMAARLGNNGAIATRIGTDPLGREAMALLKTTPLDTGYIQEDFSRVTGTVTVTLEQGSRNTPFTSPSRGTFWNSPRTGSLSRSRQMPFASEPSRSDRQRHGAPSRAFCMKRARSVSASSTSICARRSSAPEIVERSLELATIFKLNADEMPQVLSVLGFPDAGGHHA